MSFQRRRRRILAVLLSDPSFRLPILKITTSFPLPDGFPLVSPLLDRFVRPYSTKYPATSELQASSAENRSICRIIVTAFIAKVLSAIANVQTSCDQIVASL